MILLHCLPYRGQEENLWMVYTPSLYSRTKRNAINMIEYGGKWGLKQMEYHIKKALGKLKRLDADTANVSRVSVNRAIADFLEHDIDYVIADLETALIIAEQTKTPTAATEGVR